jgi:hypothetical protein
MSYPVVNFVISKSLQYHPQSYFCLYFGLVLHLYVFYTIISLAVLFIYPNKLSI